MTRTQPSKLRLTRLQRLVARERSAGKSRREIAAGLGISLQAVKKHLSRTRKRAVASQPALDRYSRVLSHEGKRVRFKSFSLLPGDNA